MPVQFKSIRAVHRLFNPLKDFALDDMPLEIRFDPLTGETGRVFDTGYRAQPVDLPAVIRHSREIFCPFCPATLAKSTPLYPEDVIPGGRIRMDGATLIPNLLPLDQYAGVAVFSDEHYVPLNGFTPDYMHPAFKSALTFIRRVQTVDTDVRFASINWNYMPPAGSSLVHPHIQVNCGAVPTNQQRRQVDACHRYAAGNDAGFWQDFMTAEIERRERYIGELGDTFWSVSFMPLSYLPDVQCIFTNQASAARLDEITLRHFLTGLGRVLLYFHSVNIYSFNMALFSVRRDEHFRLNARVSPRLLTRDIGNSDHTYSHTLHRETYCVVPPESVTRAMSRVFFRGTTD